MLWETPSSILLVDLVGDVIRISLLTRSLLTTAVLSEANPCAVLAAIADPRDLRTVRSNPDDAPLMTVTLARGALGFELD